MTRKAIVTAVGHYVPEDVLTNFDLEKRVETNNEWIVSRTGIKERRILSPELGCSYMAEKATRMLLDENNIDPAEIDLILYATVTPDMFFPSTACILQDLIGAKNAWGFDISAACSGFVYAMDTAAKFIESGQYKKVLVVGADKMSAIVDPTDRNTCILFGDAAGAILMEPGEDEQYGMMGLNIEKRRVGRPVSIDERRREPASSYSGDGGRRTALRPSGRKNGFQICRQGNGRYFCRSNGEKWPVRGRFKILYSTSGKHAHH